jgi:hypothetical protein
MHRRQCHRFFGIILFIRGISTCGRGDHRSIKVVIALTSHDQNWSKGVMVPIALDVHVLLKAFPIDKTVEFPLYTLAIARDGFLHFKYQPVFLRPPRG